MRKLSRSMRKALQVAMAVVVVVRRDSALRRRRPRKAGCLDFLKDRGSDWGNDCFAAALKRSRRIGMVMVADFGLIASPQKRQW
mmetsp:Transcript_12114/g.22844  ORF Transcript_12114/g.22844 Transcript_12114/m.22844 type:complete len:84 (+) Transcript_12114:609-860(+)